MEKDMKKFSVKYANQLGQDKKYDELYAYVKPYIREKCKDTQADALAFWGICYDFGYGVKQNSKHAVKMYKNSSNQGSMIGMFHYAYALMQGYTIEEDDEKAKLLLEKLSKKGIPEAKLHLATLSEGDAKLKLLKQAAKKNYIPAIIKLAEIYKKEDITKSVEWLKKAVALDSCQAKYELAKHYYEIKEYNEYICLLEEIANCDSETTTRAYYEKFCYLNALRKYWYSRDDYSCKVCEKLGDYYLYPWKCKDDVVDYSKAQNFFVSALEKVTSDLERFYLLLSLCEAYRQGNGFDSCAKTVVDLYSQCLDIANKNKDWNLCCSEPLFYIGLAYLKGIGVEKNSSVAVEYFIKAIGEAEIDEEVLSLCKYYLGLCYYFGDGIQRDVSKAIGYWSMKTYDDNPSKIALAYLYEQGIGCEKNLIKANELYRNHLSKSHITADGVHNYNYSIETMLESFKIRDSLLRIDKINTMKKRNDSLIQELETLKQKCYDIASSRENAVEMSEINLRKVKDLSSI